MELLYSELCKRDVINISDGRCLGRISDIKIKFPEGRLVGIFVPGRRVRGIFRWFDKTQIYIEDSKIIKIGGDVILVDIRCYDGDDRPTKPIKPPKRPQCPPPCGNQRGSQGGISSEDFSSAFSDDRIDDGDY